MVFLHLFFSSFSFSLFLSRWFFFFTLSRIWVTRKSIGMKRVFFAISAVYLWLTSNSVRKPKRFTAAIATMLLSPHVAMAVVKYFVLVSLTFNTIHISFCVCVFFFVGFRLFFNFLFSMAQFFWMVDLIFVSLWLSVYIHCDTFR